MKIIFEDSEIEKIDISTDNTLKIENLKSNIKDALIKGKVVEINGIFLCDINLSKVELLVLNNTFSIGDKKINLESRDENIAIISKNSGDILINMLNKTKMFVDKENNLGKISVKVEKGIEITQKEAFYKEFVKLFINGEGKIKVDKSVYEIEFENIKGIELEIDNIDNIPNLKNIQKETITKIVGKLEIIEQLERKGIEIKEIELIYQVDFKDGIGKIEIPKKYIDNENIFLEVEEIYKINKN